MERKIIWSFGGGVQSIAILVLIAQGKLPRPELTIMANTGRERSSTWRYFTQYAEPIFEELELPFEVAGHELAKVDLYGHNGDLLLPAFTQTGKLPTFCSDEWKKLVVRRKLRSLGYGPKKPVLMWLGMSLDEIDRLKESDKKWVKNHWPLVFDVKTRRHECELLITSCGLPIPPKSACWICPNLNNSEWQEIRLNDPQDFQNAILVDAQVRANDKNGGVFLHSQTVPLAEADFTVKEKRLPLLECANFCWT